jgi:hypothetical protein
LQKKSGAPAESGALLFYGSFEGYLGKSECLRVVFGGEVVVNCMVKRGGLMVAFRELKTCHKFLTFLWKFQNNSGWEERFTEWIGLRWQNRFRMSPVGR